MKQNLDSAHLKYMLGVRNILGPDRFKQLSVKFLSVKFQGMRKKRHFKSGHGKNWSKTNNQNQ